MKQISIQSKIVNNAIAFTILLLLLIFMGTLGGMPWWAFTIPVILFGIIVHYIKWEIAYFRVGFLSGFVVWFGINVFYDLTLLYGDRKSVV